MVLKVREMCLLSQLLPSPIHTYTVTVYHQESSVDVVLSGYLSLPSLTHSASILTEMARLLKPSGVLFLREPVTTSGQSSQVVGLIHWPVYFLLVMHNIHTRSMRV